MRLSVNIVACALAGLPLLTPVAVLAQDSEFIGVSMFGERVPAGEGVDDASGDFDSEFDPGAGRICYYLTLNGIRGANGIAIHSGEEGDIGAVVVELQLPVDPDDETCVDADSALIAQMIAAQEDYYIVVTSVGHAEGAVRGQLSD